MVSHGSDPRAYRSAQPRRVFVLGATGTIGRATVAALLARRHEVVCFLRQAADDTSTLRDGSLRGATLRYGDVTDQRSLARDGFAGEAFDVLVSCLASRSGVPQDAWAIDHKAHVDALAAARDVGVSHMVLLSAICVQRPRLAFQHAKLAFEAALMEAGVTYSIVRPTAFFKSLSGQIERVSRGRSYLVFGDGMLTACKPISAEDLADYLVACLDDVSRHNKILPIGGPSDAITPKAQGEHLFALLKRKPRFTHVSVALLSAIGGTLRAAGRVIPSAADKAEFARIAHYYATESMLLLNPATGRYDAAATPATGTETLFDYYARVINGEAEVERVRR